MSGILAVLDFGDGVTKNIPVESIEQMRAMSDVADSCFVEVVLKTGMTFEAVESVKFVNRPDL